jgi:hypothetical protein
MEERRREDKTKGGEGPAEGPDLFYDAGRETREEQ